MTIIDGGDADTIYSQVPTAGDYAAYKGIEDTYTDAERARIDAGLLNAADDINALILYSAYDSTSGEIQTAISRATCAQFDRAEETGDTGNGSQTIYQSVRIGSVALARSDRDGQQIDPNAVAYSPKAVTILTNAGLISSVVWHT